MSSSPAPSLSIQTANGTSVVCGEIYDTSNPSDDQWFATFNPSLPLALSSSSDDPLLNAVKLDIDASSIFGSSGLLVLEEIRHLKASGRQIEIYSAGKYATTIKGVLEEDGDDAAPIFRYYPLFLFDLPFVGGLTLPVTLKVLSCPKNKATGKKVPATLLSVSVLLTPRAPDPPPSAEEIMQRESTSSTRTITTTSTSGRCFVVVP
jgi:hypothetical protein